MIVYDLEIINSPDHVPNRERYKTCNGWYDYLNMGISVGVFYDTDLQEYRTFTDPIDFDELRAYLFASPQKTIVGFNNHKFDDQVLKAYGVDIPIAYSYDLLKELWIACGLSSKFSRGTHRGYSLDAVATANGLNPKSAKGYLAPIWWQDGRKQDVIDYCLNDVAITAGLATKVENDGGLINPKTGAFVKMARIV